MTTITIAGKEYPWPEGCEYFKQRHVTKEGRTCGPTVLFKYVGHHIHLEGSDCATWLEFPQYARELEAWLPIIAAIAARHFRNVQRRTGMEINALDKDKHFGPYGISTHARELVDKQADVGKAAEQWETLCNDL